MKTSDRKLPGDRVEQESANKMKLETDGKRGGGEESAERRTDRSEE